MVDYEMFCEIVKDKILDYLPEEYQNGTPIIEKVPKVNWILDGLTIHLEGRDHASRIYLKDPYQQYQSGGTLDGAMKYIALSYVAADRELQENAPNIDFSKLKDNVVMMLVNTEQNKELLKEVPNRSFQDLSVIYRWIVVQDTACTGSIIVTNETMKEAGLTEEELFQSASVNTKEMFPVRISTLFEEIISVPLMELEPDVKEILDLLPAEDAKETLWIISNNTAINGAVSMLYEENLHKLAEKVGTDLYILPSSIHEVMAASVEMGSLEWFADMVQDANRTSVALQDRLSNNVYHYDKELRKLTIATDVPDKRLDNCINEPAMVYDSGLSR